jgi:arylsulfatase A-like enzyme
MSGKPPDIGGPLLLAICGTIAGAAAGAAWMRFAPRRALTPFPRDGGALVADSGGADAATIAATALPDAPAPPPPPPRRHYNVILITVDTLRADLGFAGYPKPITPNIDALAARSTMFQRAYSTASFTPKSLGPLQIGRYAGETHRDYEHYTTFFPSNIFTAERVHDAGMRTFAAHCHRYFTFRNGMQQGFDVWDTSAMPPGMTDNDRRFSSNKMTDVAISLLSKPENVGGPQKFFAWFHYFDPHAPYVPHAGAPAFFDPNEKSKGARARAQYDEEVWFTDVHLGRLFTFIEQQPWAKDTAIIFSADHGEAFGEHNHWMHGRELWEPLVRVPLLVYLPGVQPRRIAQKRSHIDVAPTILDLLGVQIPGDGFLRGTTLVKDITSDPKTPLAERDIYIDMPVGPFNEERHALITGPSPGTKLIDYQGRRYELYDLARDPDENENLGTDKARLAPFVARMQQLRRTLQEIPPNR